MGLSTCSRGPELNEMYNMERYHADNEKPGDRNGMVQRGFPVIKNLAHKIARNGISLTRDDLRLFFPVLSHSLESHMKLF